jgi:hypothetical protein
MTMTAGSVDRTTINPTSGAAGTSSGAAGTLYSAMVSYYAGLTTPQPPAAPTLGSTSAPFSAARPCTSADVTVGNTARLTTFQGWADQANMIAQLIPYITANGHAHVTSQSLGLTPNPNDPNTAIQAPSSPVDIPLA